MEIVGDIVIVILLIIIGCYQNHKIGSLEAQIKSQKGILESADTFFKLFDLKKLKDYAEILLEKAKAEKEIEIAKIKTELEEAVKGRGIMTKGYKFIEAEYFTLYDAFLDFVFGSPINLRKEIIDHMGEGIVKKKMKEVNKTLEEKENISRKAITEAFLRKNKEKAIEGTE